MSASFVQSAAATQGAGASIAKAYGSAVGAGHFLVCMVGWGSNVATCTVSDSVNGAWTAIGAPQTGIGAMATARAQMFYLKNSGAGTPTVTATFAGAVPGFGVIAIHEYAGLDTVNPIDASAYSSPAAATSVGISVTTARANECIFAASVAQNASASVNAPFTIRETTNFGNNGSADDVNTGAPGTYTATFNNTSGGNPSADTDILGIVALFPPAVVGNPGALLLLGAGG